MIGQHNLQSRIKQLIENRTFPRFSILVGPKGSGKKTLVEEVIRPKLNLSIIDITDTITLDIIYDILIIILNLHFIII